MIILKVDLKWPSARWQLAGFALTAMLTIVLCAASALAADLSPGKWPTSTRKALEGEEFFFFPPFAGPVRGHAILVSGTVSPVAVHAGVEALRQGGTAADAAATVALTQVATYLGSVTSYAGVLQFLYFDAKSGKVYDLDAGWATYQHETDPATIPEADVSIVSGNPAPPPVTHALGRQTLVPGFMAGIEAIHTRFGRLGFANLFQPSIWYAEHGVVITPGLAQYFRFRQKQLWRTHEGREFASMPDGSLPKVGDVFVQPELAKTLGAVATHGASYMYTGDWAKAYVAAVRAEGGKVTLEDLARYRPEWREPLSVQFAGATVFGPGEDPSGDCPTLEALNLLSALKIDTLGPYWRDPKAFVAYAHALRFATYAGDSLPKTKAFKRDHGLAPGCDTRLSPQFADAIAPNLTTLMGQPEVVAAPHQHTEAVVVVDRWGNVAALVHTINTVDWGDTGIVVGGIPVSDAGGLYRNEPAVMKPGARLPNSLSPVIALRGGRPVLAVATVGVSLVPETTRLVAGRLANGLDLQTLMSAPPLLLNVSPYDPKQGVGARAEVVPSDAYDARILQALTGAGVPIREETPQRVGSIKGTAVVAEIDQPGGSPHTVEVPSVFGFAESDVQRGAVPPKGLALNRLALDRYVGEYQIHPGLDIRISREGDHLVGQETAFPPANLIANAQDHFLVAAPNAQITFHLGPSGKATELVISAGGINTTARRIAPSGVTAHEGREVSERGKDQPGEKELPAAH